MRHGSIRAAVIGSVFRLRRFTVPALAEDSGLDRGQIYPILDQLESQGYLSKTPIPQEKRKPERPLNLYALVDQPELKTRLIDEFAPSLRLAAALEEPTEPEALIRARISLDALGKELAELVAEFEILLNSNQCTLRVTEIQQKLDTVAEDLKIALLRMGVAEKAELPPALETELRRLEESRAELDRIREKTEVAVEAKLKQDQLASQTFREAFSYGIAALGKAAVEAVSPVRFAKYYKKDQEPAWLANVFDTANQSHFVPKGLISDLYYDFVDYKHRNKPTVLETKLNELFEQRYHEAPSLESRHLIAALKNNVNSVFRENAPSRPMALLILWTLGEYALRHASDPDTAFWISKSLEHQIEDDNRSFCTYNSLNLCFLAGNEKAAWASWRNLRVHDNQHFFGSAVRPTFAGLLVAIVSPELLKREHLEKVGEYLGSSFSCSVVASERVAGISQDPYVLEPSVYNLLSSSERIPLSSGLKMLTPRFFVYGPMESSMRKPGVPAITLATGLAGMGLPATDAQEIAEQVGPGKALVVVNTSGELERHSFDQLNGFLRILDPDEERCANALTLTSVDPSSTPESVRSGRPVLYELDRKGVLNRTYALATEKHFYANEK